MKNYVLFFCRKKNVYVLFQSINFFFINITTIANSLYMQQIRAFHMEIISEMNT